MLKFTKIRIIIQDINEKNRIYDIKRNKNKTNFMKN